MKIVESGNVIRVFRILSSTPAIGISDQRRIELRGRVAKGVCAMEIMTPSSGWAAVAIGYAFNLERMLERSLSEGVRKYHGKMARGRPGPFHDLARMVWLETLRDESLAEYGLALDADSLDPKAEYRFLELLWKTAAKREAHYYVWPVNET
jgi:hypothetical protein